VSQFSIRLGDSGSGLGVVVVIAAGSGSFDVVGSAEDGRGAVELAERTRPDVLLLDDEALADAESVASQVREAAPDTRVVVVSGKDAEACARGLLAHGAHGVLDRTVSPERLLSGVTTLLSEAASGVAARLEPRAESAGRARRLAESVVRAWGEEEVAEVLTLLVSELVGNAIRHSDSDIYVVITLRSRVVRVEVEDRSPQRPVPRFTDGGAESGRGLGIVDALSSAWGVEPAGEGKVVWFEVPLS
jgi:DNA-binding NarL/FixJ family response regulator